MYFIQRCYIVIHILLYIYRYTKVLYRYTYIVIQRCYIVISATEIHKKSKVRQGTGCSSEEKSFKPPTITTGYCLLYITMNSTVYSKLYTPEFRYVGCPATQWDVTIQPVKTIPKHCQNKSYAIHKLVTYFSLSAIV